MIRAGFSVKTNSKWKSEMDSKYTEGANAPAFFVSPCARYYSIQTPINIRSEEKDIEKENSSWKNNKAAKAPPKQMLSKVSMPL